MILQSSKITFNAKNNNLQILSPFAPSITHIKFFNYSTQNDTKKSNTDNDNDNNNDEVENH